MGYGGGDHIGVGGGGVSTHNSHYGLANLHEEYGMEYGPKHERSNLRAQNTSKVISGPKTIFCHVDWP